MDWSSLETFLLLERKWSPATVAEQVRHLQRAQRQGLDLDNFSLGAAKQHMARKLREGASPSAFNNLVKCLKAVSLWRGLDASQLKLGKPQRSRYKFLSPEQVKACLNYRCYPKKREPFRRALLLLLLKTGLRLGEVVSLRVQDVDRTTQPSRIYVGKPTKRGSRRWIPIEPWAVSPKRALGAFMAGRPPDGTILHWDGRAATTADVRRELQAISRDLGFRVNCTITRHTRATELRRRGWDLLALKEYLGHANISSTAVYAAVTQEDLQHLMKTKGSGDPWTGTSRWQNQ